MCCPISGQGKLRERNQMPSIRSTSPFSANWRWFRSESASCEPSLNPVAGTLPLTSPKTIIGNVFNVSQASGHQRLLLVYEELVVMNLDEPLLTVR